MLSLHINATPVSPFQVIKNILTKQFPVANDDLRQHYYDVVTLRKTSGQCSHTVLCIAWRYEWGLSPDSANVLNALSLWSKIRYRVLSLSTSIHGCIKDILFPFINEVYQSLFGGLILYHIAFPDLVPKSHRYHCPMTTKDSFDAFVLMCLDIHV
jgi:hypothetical protein